MLLAYIRDFDFSRNWTPSNHQSQFPFFPLFVTVAVTNSCMGKVIGILGYAKPKSLLKEIDSLDNDKVV